MKKQLTPEQKQDALRHLQNLMLDIRGRMVSDRKDFEFWETVDKATHKDFPDE